MSKKSLSIDVDAALEFIEDHLDRRQVNKIQHSFPFAVFGPSRLCRSKTSSTIGSILPGWIVARRLICTLDPHTVSRQRRQNVATACFRWKYSRAMPRSKSTLTISSAK